MDKAPKIQLQRSLNDDIFKRQFADTKKHAVSTSDSTPIPGTFTEALMYKARQDLLGILGETGYKLRLGISQGINPSPSITQMTGRDTDQRGRFNESVNAPY